MVSSLLAVSITASAYNMCVFRF